MRDFSIGPFEPNRLAAQDYVKNRLMLSFCMPRQKPLWALLVALLLVACQPSPPAPPPLDLDPDEIATSVAATLSALQTQAATATPTPLPDILPHSLYFLSQSAGSPQIWRLERNGHDLSQVTDHDESVLDFDLHQPSGALVYTTGTNLIHITSDGGVQSWGLQEPDQALPAIGRQISSPRISPDGRWLAYADNGLRLIDLSSGESQLLLANEWQQLEDGSLIPQRLFFPASWSPDGAQLLVSIAYLEAGSLAFLNLESEQLTEFQASGIVCCQTTWAANSASLYVASPYLGLIDSGLWRYSLADGREESLIPSTEEDATVNLVGWPLALPDGGLRFFYAETAGIPEGDTPLLMASARAGTWQQPQALREDAFQIQDALWAPDGSLAVILPTLQGQPGPLILAHEDGRPLQLLVDAAWNLRWGP